MRSAKWLTSGIVEPPKPRLMTGRSGKASAVCQRRIVELPTKRMQSFGTAFWWSHFSNAAISDSKRAGPVSFFVEGADGSFAKAAEFVSHEKAQKSTKRNSLSRVRDAVADVAFIFVTFVFLVATNWPTFSRQLFILHGDFFHLVALADSVDDFLCVLDHFAEDRMLVVEPGRRDVGDEELGAVRVGARVRH